MAYPQHTGFLDGNDERCVGEMVSAVRGVDGARFLALGEGAGGLGGLGDVNWTVDLEVGSETGEVGGDGCVEGEFEGDLR